MTEMIDTKQIELHFEKANMAAETVDRGKGLIVLGVITAGKSLLEAKGMVPHGEWAVWLAKHWDHSQSLASKYMKIANSEHVPNLKDAKSMREALSLAMVCDEDVTTDEPIVPRAERKTGRVAVENPGQTAVQAESNSSATLTSPPEKDDDPNPAPKTNTQHSPATAKAKEADRAVPMAVTPVIVEEPVSREEAEEQIVETWVKETGFHDSVLRVAELSTRLTDKARAKVLRTIADKFDPPAVGAPSIEAVLEWASSEGIQDFDAEKFFNHYSLAGWKYGKAKTPIKDWRRAAINAYSGGKGWAVDGANRLPF
jgi:hypothetical protein